MREPVLAASAHALARLDTQSKHDLASCPAARTPGEGPMQTRPRFVSTARDRCITAVAWSLSLSYHQGTTNAMCASEATSDLGPALRSAVDSGTLSLHLPRPTATCHVWGGTLSRRYAHQIPVVGIHICSPHLRTSPSGRPGAVLGLDC